MESSVAVYQFASTGCLTEMDTLYTILFTAYKIDQRKNSKGLKRGSKEATTVVKLCAPQKIMR